MSSMPAPSPAVADNSRAALPHRCCLPPIPAAAGLLVASAAGSAAKCIRDMRDEAVQQKRRLLWKMANSRCGGGCGGFECCSS